MFSIEWDVDGVECAVEGYYTPGEPAYMSGHPDNWHPGYGPEVEIENVEVIDIEDLVDYIFDHIDDDGPFALTVGPFYVEGTKEGYYVNVDKYGVDVSVESIGEHLDENQYWSY